MGYKYGLRVFCHVGGNFVKMFQIRPVITLILGFLVVLASTGIPHLAHLCMADVSHMECDSAASEPSSSCCEQEDTCCEPEQEEVSCCRDLMHVHQIVVPDGGRRSAGQELLGLINQAACGVLPYMVAEALEPSVTTELGQYLARLSTSSPPLVLATPLRL